MIIRREMGEKGQVVIPKDIRELLSLRARSKVIFEIENNEVKLKPEKTAEEIVEDFLNVPKLKKKLTTKQMKELLEEQYELP